MYLKENDKHDLLRTNRTLTATREYPRITGSDQKEKVTELEEKIQLKQTQFQGATEKLKEYLRRLVRAAPKRVKQNRRTILIDR